MGLRTNINNAYDALRGRERANPVAGTLFDKLSKDWGVGDRWAKTGYGDYYPSSVSVYAAIKLRQEAIARVPLYVYRETDEGLEQVEPDHALQKLLDRVNRWWTRGDLWRATETYLSLWGSAYWALTREGGEITEIWALRPDKMKVIPDTQEYIKGFLYGTGKDSKAFAPDEIVWFRYFNPLDEYAGLSPIAPVRLSLEMGMDALKTNRHALKNDTTPGMIISVSDTPTDEEVMSFYNRWESRFSGPENSRRPAILSEGMTASNLGFSPKDMLALENMRWAVEEVARTFNVPMPLLHDLSRATYANIETARKSFWEDCISLQLAFYEEELTEMLLPLFGEEGLVVKFDTSNVPALQEDEDAKATRRDKYVKSGVMTVNEVRADMGLEAIGSIISYPTLAAIDAGVLTVNEVRGDMGMPPVEWGDSPPAPPPAPMAMSITDGTASTRSPFDWEVEGRDIDTTQRRKGKKLEDAFRRELVTLMRQQSNSIIREFEKQAEERVVSTNGATAVKTVHRDVFNKTGWIPQFTALARKHLTAGLLGAAETQNTKFKLGVSFDIAAPEVKSWIGNRAKFFAEKVNTTTGDKVLNIIGKGRKDGTSVGDIAKKLREFGEFNTTARSERIARTEMTVAQGQGNLQTFKQAEVPAKRWYTALDDRVRDNHMDVHGQIIALNEMFRVGSDMMEGPGQGSDPAENINCRCVIIPEGMQGG